MYNAPVHLNRRLMRNKELSMRKKGVQEFLVRKSNAGEQLSMPRGAMEQCGDKKQNITGKVLWDSNIKIYLRDTVPKIQT